VLGEDVATAALAATAAAMPYAFVPMNIGTGIPTSNEQLVAALSRTRRIFSTLADGSPSYSCANIDRARALLGFEPSPLTD
jgi:nucleoside-diphosphate-sugar epimerase